MSALPVVQVLVDGVEVPVSNLIFRSESVGDQVVFALGSSTPVHIPGRVVTTISIDALIDPELMVPAVTVPDGASDDEAIEGLREMLSELG